VKLNKICFTVKTRDEIMHIKDNNALKAFLSHKEQLRTIRKFEDLKIESEYLARETTKTMIWIGKLFMIS